MLNRLTKIYNRDKKEEEKKKRISSEWKNIVQRWQGIENVFLIQENGLLPVP